MRDRISKLKREWKTRERGAPTDAYACTPYRGKRETSTKSREKRKLEAGEYTCVRMRARARACICEDR